MKKRKLLSLTCINIGVLLLVGAILFLFLPKEIQQSLSIALYSLAIIAGLIIGNLFAKVIFLNKKIKKETQLLEQRQADLQEYIGNVVHDLRSPVASINMISELLESDLDDISEMHKNLISSIHVSSANMLERICCILDNAKAQQKGVFENMNYENPYSTIESVVNKHHILAIEKDIKIQLDIKKELPSVSFDKEALDSILSNLLSNAIKYSENHTIIRIYSKFDSKGFTIYVKDQGLGMTKDDLKKVFGRFMRLSSQPTGGEDSSGLGLSIVKNLAERMQGSVNAESEGKGFGSTFSVSLTRSEIKAKHSA